jgi:hypothetical protein
MYIGSHDGTLIQEADSPPGKTADRSKLPLNKKPS